MAHDVHTTKALVMRRAPSREGDAVIWLLTKDFGLIPAVAQSVRKERSKMRFALQDLSSARVSLVRGRDIWRITGAEEDEMLLQETEVPVRVLMGRVAAIISRLVPSEDVHTTLYDVCHTGFQYAATTRNEEERNVLELLLVARVLYVLGYMKDKDIYRDFITTPDISDELLQHVSAIQKELLHDVNAGLSESQL